MNEIEKNLLLINQKIQKACQTYSRKAKNVDLIAVSKTISSEKIILAINAGQKIFGENYIKEAKEKWPALKQQFSQIRLHFIGHLQSNKIAEALDLFDCIESLDSEKLALEIKKAIAKKQQKNAILEQNLAKNAQKKDFLGKNCEILIQINIGEESQKSGINPKEAKEFINFAKNDCGLNIAGLMCVPPSREEASPYFALLNKIAQENNLQKLSMGMSSDFEEAIALGATQIRIGSAIFGARS